jgi:hypothetical protein
MVYPACVLAPIRTRKIAEREPPTDRRPVPLLRIGRIQAIVARPSLSDAISMDTRSEKGCIKLV